MKNDVLSVHRQMSKSRREVVWFLIPHVPALTEYQDKLRKQINIYMGYGLLDISP